MAVLSPNCRFRWTALLGLALAAACATAPDAPGTMPSMPEGASGFEAKPGWATQKFAVAAAHPLASQAGAQMLRAGGTAVDAAVAVQMVLTLVEPQSSGIGGGALLLHWDGSRVAAYDGRETAPAGVDEGLFLRADGTEMPLQERLLSARSVGVPGVLRMLELAHGRHGRLPWARLFEPAIHLAEQGFPLGARMYQALNGDLELRQDRQAAATYYQSDGRPWPVGHRLRNPALAEVLRRVARDGSAALHEGAIAEDMVGRVRSHSRGAGSLSLADLRDYRARQREPICSDWKASYLVCGFGPPSSGHLTVMQLLGLLEQLPPVSAPLVDGLPAADWLHLYAEAARLAFADRDQFIADPDFVAAPGGDWSSLLAASYLRQRAALVGPRSMGVARPGRPDARPSRFAPQPVQPEQGTSHISIVDAEGHALAMTTTIEAAWGSHIMSDGGTGMAGGFMLNNQLSDFSPRATDAQGRPVANRVQPGKRPRSSMSPTLVFDKRDGRLLMTLGSPGGAAIIHFTAKTLIAALDWGLDVQQAMALPNFGSFNGPTVLERGRFPRATIAALQGRGHRVAEVELTSGLQAIQRRAGGGWFGGADPRREGVVVGD